MSNLKSITLRKTQTQKNYYVISLGLNSRKANTSVTGKDH